MTRILIIDDEKIIRERLKNLLDLSGYEAFTASDGPEGLKVFHKVEPEIVLLDVKMPGMDGIEVLKKIKKEAKETEVIIITQFGEVDTAIKAMKEGAFDYIQKPVNYDELEIEIKRALEKQEMKRKLAEHVHNLEEAAEEKERGLKIHKQAEEELKETKDFLEKIIESSLDGIMVTDSKGYVAKVNKYFLDMLGYADEEEVIDMFVAELTPFNEFGIYESTTGESIEISKEFVEHTNIMLARLIEEGKVTNWESYRLRKDKKIIPVDQNIVYLYDKKGERIGSVGIIRDITERKKAEKKLIESREFLENIFKTTADGIIVTGNQSKITMANAAAEKILGYSRDELIGKSVEELTPEGKKYQEEGNKFITRLRKDGVITNFGRTWLKEDGSLVDVEVNGAMIKDNKGNVQGAIASIREVTERKQAEEEVRNTKDFLDNIIENSSDCIMVSDRTGYITRANKYFLKLFGYREEEIVGKHMMEITPFNQEGNFESTTGELIQLGKEYTDNANAMVSIFLEEGKVTNWEDYYFNKDRKLVPVEQSIVCLYDKEGERSGAVAIARDVTERKKIYKELKEGRDFLQNIFNTSLDGIMVTDGQGCIVRVNSAIEKLLGFPENEILGKHTVELSPQDEEHSKNSVAMLELLFEKGFVTNWEIEWLRKDGTLCPTEVNITSLRDPEGNHCGSVALIRDITARKDIEEEHIRLNSAIEQATDIVMIMGPDGTIQYINTAAESLLGYKREEVIGQNVFQPKRGIHDKKFYQGIQETISKGTVWTGQVTYKKKDASLCEFKMTISPILDKSGKIINFVAIGSDVTNELKLEHQLQQAKKMEAVGTLAGGVAHDLNNVLSGILSYPELLLLDLPQDSPLRKPILTIQKSGEKAAAIVHDMLTLARRGVAITEVINLNDVVSDYLSSPEFEKLKSFHPNIRFKTKLKRDLLNVLGSPVHLSKTVMNLVSNAAEAVIEGGEVKISTTNQYVDKEINGYDNVTKGDYAILRISDTGMGISADDIEKIFEPFYTKKTMGRSGTGLGMAVVWGTVTDHKGYIDVQSIEEKGTTFTIYFPVTRKELGKDMSLLSMEEYMGKGETILVVDDVEEQREIATNILTKLGYSVTTASSGEEAVKYMKDNSPDLVALDMIMDPGIDGLETYKNILETHPGQKAVITSGFSETNRVKEAKQIGAGAYVKKPYAMGKIGMAVKTELGK